MKRISRKFRTEKVTLYNFVSSTSGVATYQRTVIDLVYLDTGYAQRLSGRGIATADKAQLIIDLRDMKTTEDRTYLPYKEWSALADKSAYFTFWTANDFFVEGDAIEELPAITKAQMQSKYQCFGISSVSAPADNVLLIIGR